MPFALERRWAIFDGKGPALSGGRGVQRHWLRTPAPMDESRAAGGYPSVDEALLAAWRILASNPEEVLRIVDVESGEVIGLVAPIEPGTVPTLPVVSQEQEPPSAA